MLGTQSGGDHGDGQGAGPWGQGNSRRETLSYHGVCGWTKSSLLITLNQLLLKTANTPALRSHVAKAHAEQLTLILRSLKVHSKDRTPCAKTRTHVWPGLTGTGTGVTDPEGPPCHCPRTLRACHPASPSVTSLPPSIRSASAVARPGSNLHPLAQLPTAHSPDHCLWPTWKPQPGAWAGPP